MGPAENRAFSRGPLNGTRRQPSAILGPKNGPFNGPKKSWAPRKVSIFCRTHLETYNRPHLVIWSGRFYKKRRQVYSTGALIVTIRACGGWLALKFFDYCVNTTNSFAMTIWAALRFFGILIYFVFFCHFLIHDRATRHFFHGGVKRKTFKKL